MLNSIMEATQAIDFALDSTQDTTNEGASGHIVPKKLIGIIKFEEEHKEYSIFQGDTIFIGRDPEHCQIVLQSKVSTIV